MSTKKMSTSYKITSTNREELTLQRQSTPSLMQNITKKELNLTHRHINPLMMSTTFPISNTSPTKEVSVGLNPSDQTFSPEIQIVTIVDNSRRGVCLDQEEWEKFMVNADHVNRYFDNTINVKYRFQISSRCWFHLQNQAMVIVKSTNESSEVYLADTIILQKSNWIELLAAKECISQTLNECVLLCDKSKNMFDVLDIHVMQYVRSIPDVSTAGDDRLAILITEFLQNLDLNSLGIDTKDHLLCQTIALFCSKVFISSFHVKNFFSSFRASV